MLNDAFIENLQQIAVMNKKSGPLKADYLLHSPHVSQRL